MRTRPQCFQFGLRLGTVLGGLKLDRTEPCFNGKHRMCALNIPDERSALGWGLKARYSFVHDAPSLMLNEI